MKYWVYLSVLLWFLPGLPLLAQEIQLATPQTGAPRLFLHKGQRIAFDFRLQGAVIRYTTNGSEPTEASPLYARPLSVKKPMQIRAKAFLEGFAPSASTLVRVLPSGAAPNRVQTNPVAAAAYPGDGPGTLSDGQLGDEDFHQHWLGFNAPQVVLTLDWNKPQRLHQINLSLLQMQGAWIFLPRLVEVRDEQNRVIGSKTIQHSDQQAADALESISLAIPRRKYRRLTVTVTGWDQLPDWHSGKGKQGWMFMDEVWGE